MRRNKHLLFQCHIVQKVLPTAKNKITTNYRIFSIKTYFNFSWYVEIRKLTLMAFAMYQNFIYIV